MRAAAVVAGARVGGRGARIVRPATEIRCLPAAVGDPGFRRRSRPELIADHAPEAIPVLFGHIGEGNLHLNVLRCCADSEPGLYAAMMTLIAQLRRQRQL